MADAEKDTRANTSRPERRGLLFSLSAPSGAGKTSLARRLLEDDEDGLALSISVTTRAPREGEVDGVDYHFITVETFEAMKRDNALLEWAPVHSNFYGTPRAPVEERLATGGDVLFDIDWQGAAQLFAQMPDDLVRVFILPPSADALKARLVGRGKDAMDVIEARLKRAADEIGQWQQFDYVIVNDDFEASAARLKSILHVERGRRSRDAGLDEFINQLQSDLRSE
ncbi:MAG: guanylate kinase [Pseudomonadota bacterium]